MRVISGKCRSIQLKTLPGDNTRPTTDRIKETLFNMIGNDIIDINFLDLFSGSGQIGIEALSRGAKSATFIEQNKKAIEIINANLEKTKLKSNAKVIASDVLRSLETLSGKYDIVFMDPPYNKLLEKNALEILKNSSIISNESLIIIEESMETDDSYVSNLGFEIIKTKLYKTNKHLFVKRSE